MKFRIKRNLTALACALSVAAFAGNAMAQAPKSATKFNYPKAIKELTAQNKIFIAALAASDPNGAASIYTSDAQILNHGKPQAVGRAQVARFYGAMIRRDITKFSYKTLTLWGSDMDQMMEKGTLVFALKNGKKVTEGTYELIWKRENGKLKISRDAFPVGE